MDRTQIAQWRGNSKTLSMEQCIDGSTHLFIPVVNQDQFVFCQKCLMCVQLETGTVPIPEPPKPIPNPPDAVIYRPSGGDDTSALQHVLDEYHAKPVMISGMCKITNTLWFNGDNRILCGDSAVKSGFLSSAPGPFSGHYGALLCVQSNKSAIRNLEFDGQNNPTEMVFFDGGSDNLIELCYFHDINFREGNAPYAAIHSQNCINLTVRGNTIERTKGRDGGEGVRGIWIPGVSGTLIESNTVRDTGHTGIAIEGNGGTIRNNVVEKSLTQGTGYKMMWRGSGQSGFIFTGNKVNETVGAGLMLEAMGNQSLPIIVDGNEFGNCGKQGTRFGAFYVSSTTRKIDFKNNKLNNCRTTGALIHVSESSFTNNSFESMNGVLDLESDCHKIDLTRSGSVNVGSNCNEITVDGVKVA